MTDEDRPLSSLKEVNGVLYLASQLDRATASQLDKATASEV